MGRAALQTGVVVLRVLGHGKPIGFTLEITQICHGGAENKILATAPAHIERTEVAFLLERGRAIGLLAPPNNLAVNGKQPAVVGNKRTTLLRQPQGLIAQNQGGLLFDRQRQTNDVSTIADLFHVATIIHLPIDILQRHLPAVNHNRLGV